MLPIIKFLLSENENLKYDDDQFTFSANPQKATAALVKITLALHLSTFGQLPTKQHENRVRRVRCSCPWLFFICSCSCVEQATVFKFTLRKDFPSPPATHSIRSESPPRTRSHSAQHRTDAAPTTSSVQWRQEGRPWWGRAGCCTGGGRRRRSPVWYLARYWHWTCGLKERTTQERREGVWFSHTLSQNGFVEESLLTQCINPTANVAEHKNKQHVTHTHKHMNTHVQFNWWLWDRGLL